MSGAYEHIRLIPWEYLPREVIETYLQDYMSRQDTLELNALDKMARTEEEDVYRIPMAKAIAKKTENLNT